MTSLLFNGNVVLKDTWSAIRVSLWEAWLYHDACLDQCKLQCFKMQKLSGIPLPFFFSSLASCQSYFKRQHFRLHHLCNLQLIVLSVRNWWWFMSNCASGIMKRVGNTVSSRFLLCGSSFCKNLVQFLRRWKEQRFKAVYFRNDRELKHV